MHPNRSIQKRIKNSIKKQQERKLEYFKIINELFVLIKNHTDTLNERTKRKPQETLGNKLNKEMGNFSFSAPKKLSQTRKSVIRSNFF